MPLEVKSSWSFYLIDESPNAFLDIIGVDEGLISGTLAKTQFAHQLGLDLLCDEALADVKGNIAAMVQIGSVGGAAL